MGGIDLAAEWAGFETVLQVEKDPYCQKVLAKHWPNVKRIERVEDVTRESIDRPVTLVSGGFPCQPFSVAGKRRGKEDDRYLWPEMLRVIQEIKPSWVLGENVANFLNMGLEDALSDLEAEGYEVAPPFVVPAVGVDAPHLRYRIFFVAHTDSPRIREQSKSDTRSGCETFAELYCKDVAYASIERKGRLSIRQGRSYETTCDSERCCQDVADTINGGSQDRWPEGYKKTFHKRDENQRPEIEELCGSWWTTEPDVGRVAHGVPSRVDRLRALGNAVVPQQVYPMLRAIADIELGGERY